MSQTEGGPSPPDPFEETYAATAAFFDNVFLESRRQLQYWRALSLGLILLSAILTVALTRLSLDHRVVPYIVERGPFGNLVELGEATQTADRQELVGWFLARWVEDARAISSDPDLQRARWLRAYSFTTKTARPALSEYHRALDDLKTPRRVWTHDPIRIAENSYQIRWEERTGTAPREEWVAVLETETVPSQSRRASNPNPLGIYIKHFHWVPQGAQTQGGTP